MAEDCFLNLDAAVFGARIPFEGDASKTEKNGRRFAMNNDINEIQQDFEVLKYFQDEFQYRHKHLVNVMIKLFALDVLA